MVSGRAPDRLREAKRRIRRWGAGPAIAPRGGGHLPVRSRLAAGTVPPIASDLTSVGPPPPGDDDRVRGSGPIVVLEYGDYECPYCARADLLLAELPIT